ncbi:MAG: ribose 5-phosphate isomerase B, partial [Polyangiales bacterium]
MKIVAGADHGGFVLKNELVLYLREKGHEVEDLGTHSDTSVDYPDYGLAVARAVLENRAERGLLVCGTGVGIAIAANRHLGIRAVNCSDVFTARLSRSHNDSNVLSLGGRVVGIGLAKEILDAWLNQAFEG